LSIAAGRHAWGVVAAAGAILGTQLAIGWVNDALDAPRDAAVGRTDKPVAAGLVSRRLVAVLGGVAAVVTVPLAFLSGVPAAAAVALAFGPAGPVRWTGWTALAIALAVMLVGVYAASRDPASKTPFRAVMVVALVDVVLLLVGSGF